MKSSPSSPPSWTVAIFSSSESSKMIFFLAAARRGGLVGEIVDIAATLIVMLSEAPVEVAVFCLLLISPMVFGVKNAEFVSDLGD